MITIDELFGEDFKPEWMIRQEQEVAESFSYAIQAATDLQYKLNAYAILKKIASRESN